MAIRGAALVERVARCGSAGLRPAAPAASATRIDAVFIIALDLCVRRVVCGLLSGSVSSSFAVRWRSVSSDLLSGDALRLFATVRCNDCCFSDRFDGVRCL